MLEYVTTHDDAGGIFSRWQLAGANRGNTDHGRAYVKLAESAGDFTVSLYSDPGRSQLMARGTLNGDTDGDVTLNEQNLSGLSGSVHLSGASTVKAAIDIFYADDADVTGLQKDIAEFINAGQFAGAPGFSDPLARAKRVIDALMNARFPAGWRADDLQPLAEATARYALFFIHDHLSTRPDDPSAYLAAHWRHEARLVLPQIGLSLNGVRAVPFDSRITRA